MRGTLVLGLLAAMMILTENLTPASALPVAYSDIVAFDTNVNGGAGQGFVGTTSATGAVGGAGATIVSSPFPAISAYASVGDNQSAGIYGTYAYYFEFVGPNTSALPVIINAQGEVTGNAATPSDARVLFGGGEVIGSACEASNSLNCDSFGGVNHSFAISVTKFLQSNTQYEITMHLDVFANTLVNTDLQASASGYVDPYIFLDPNFTSAGDFTLELSPGVQNNPATTPLPAALPLFASGLGGLGLLGWRRKKKTQATA